MVARATRHKEYSLERRKSRSSQQFEASGLQPRNTLERMNSCSSEETQNIQLARSSEGKLARAMTCNSQVQNQTQTQARVQDFSLKPPDTTPNSRLSEGTLARAKELKQRARSSDKALARAKKQNSRQQLLV